MTSYSTLIKDLLLTVHETGGYGGADPRILNPDVLVYFCVWGGIVYRLSFIVYRLSFRKTPSSVLLGPRSTRLDIVLLLTSFDAT